MHAGATVADSDRAWILVESGYPDVVYFPRDDVALDRFETSETVSYCPFKGNARYVALDGVDVGWFYPDPYDEVDDIQGCIAFCTDHVEVSDTQA
jgi:uncharacterized protein (DUF427 family)